MDSLIDDQQPIARIVGRRVAPPVGVPPSAEARVAWAALSVYLTRVPKGVFVYSSHAEMTADRERWLAEAMVARKQARA